MAVCRRFVSPYTHGQLEQQKLAECLGFRGLGRLGTNWSGKCWQKFKRYVYVGWYRSSIHSPIQYSFLRTIPPMLRTQDPHQLALISPQKKLSERDPVVREHVKMWIKGRSAVAAASLRIAKPLGWGFRVEVLIRVTTVPLITTLIKVVLKHLQ